MRALLKNLTGLALGLVAGLVVTDGVVPLAAQAIAVYRIHANNAACWDQPEGPGVSTLAEANALRVEVAYDVPLVGPGGTFTPTQIQCTGTAAPWRCEVRTPMPMSLQTVGNHRAIVRTAIVDPVDGAQSDWSIAMDHTFELRNLPAPPPPGTNGRIVKIVIAAIVTAAVWLWRLLT